MNGVFTVAELDRQRGIPGVARFSEGNGRLARVQITAFRGGGDVSAWRPGDLLEARGQ